MAKSWKVGMRPVVPSSAIRVHVRQLHERERIPRARAREDGVKPSSMSIVVPSVGKDGTRSHAQSTTKASEVT